MAGGSCSWLMEELSARLERDPALGAECAGEARAIKAATRIRPQHDLKLHAGDSRPHFALAARWGARGLLTPYCSAGTEFGLRTSGGAGTWRTGNLDPHPWAPGGMFLNERASPPRPPSQALSPPSLGTCWSTAPIALFRRAVGMRVRSSKAVERAASSLWCPQGPCGYTSTTRWSCWPPARQGCQLMWRAQAPGPPPCGPLISPVATDSAHRRHCSKKALTLCPRGRRHRAFDPSPPG